MAIDFLKSLPFFPAKIETSDLKKTEVANLNRNIYEWKSIILFNRFLFSNCKYK